MQDLLNEPLRELVLDPAQVQREGCVPLAVVVRPRASLTRLRLSLVCNAIPECAQAQIWIAPVGNRPVGAGRPSEELGASTRSADYAPLVLSDEPMAYGQLDAEADGVRDSTGHGHDGVINGVARPAPGRDDPALSLVGRGGSVAVPARLGVERYGAGADGRGLGQARAGRRYCRQEPAPPDGRSIWASPTSAPPLPVPRSSREPGPLGRGSTSCSPRTAARRACWST